MCSTNTPTGIPTFYNFYKSEDVILSAMSQSFASSIFPLQIFQKSLHFVIFYSAHYAKFCELATLLETFYMTNPSYAMSQQILQWITYGGGRDGYDRGGLTYHGGGFCIRTLNVISTNFSAGQERRSGSSSWGFIRIRTGPAFSTVMISWFAGVNLFAY